MSHLDVVDAPSPFFDPVLRDGRLYGRGSIDDKYAVALCLVLFRERWKRLESGNGEFGDLPLGLLITGDEEIGGYRGAGRALETLRADFAVVLDGGGLCSAASVSFMMGRVSCRERNQAMSVTPP